jgi:hypothetical protein
VRNFTVHSVEQKSGPWQILRLGRVTGSRASAVVATRKNGKNTQEMAARRDLRTQLVVERLTGQPQDNDLFVRDIQRGIELEPEARKAYEARTGNIVRQVGFVRSSDLMIGYSPDGYVDDFAGLVEVKCPRPATHLSYLQTGTIPEQYKPQVLHGMITTGATWVDFVSYCPAFPAPIRLLIKRIVADPRELAAYELALRLFLGEVEKEYNTTVALQHAGYPAETARAIA